MRVMKTRDKTTKLINFKCRGSKIILHPLIVKLVTAGKTMLKKEYGFGEVFDVFNELGIIRNKLRWLVPTVLTSATDRCSGSLTELGDLGGWLIL